MLLEGKVIVVSGIGPGLGVKLAVEAAREGARGIVLAARSAAKLEDAQSRVRAVSTSCQILKISTDIRDLVQCRHLAATAIERFGRIDGLINNAFEHGAFEPVDSGDLQQWQSAYDTNVVGSVQMTRAVVPAMKAQGGGAVVMINTMATIKPFVGEAGYAASKGALLVAAKYLAIELGPNNIRVNTARMGWMWGAPVEGYVGLMAQAQGVSQKQIVDGIAANIPLRRLVLDDECARAALFLVSDYASAITGAIIDVNGGEALT
jgi:NAD(P)-dependent dehydrogenase (short-subunit alcohol dehydrogenase family)